MANKSDQPIIIIKKIKKVSGGHHGGAWKVAYADFVTAMMAFFLLLWLLAAASEEQKQGLQEYFTPTIGLKDSQGIGFDGGDSSTSEDGTSKTDTSQVNLVLKQPDAGEITNDDKESAVDGDEESLMFDDAKKEIAQAVESDPSLSDFSENIMMEQSPEGLKIELRDSDKYTMFKPGSTELSDAGKKLLTSMTPIIRKLPNHISLSGHTDALAYSGKNKKYSNWELSTDRALSARRFLESNALTAERVKKIVGYSSSNLVLPDNPTSSVNRRIEIILLRGSHLSLLPQAQTAPRSLLTVPNASNTLKKRQQRIREEEASTSLLSAPDSSLSTAPQATAPIQAEPIKAEPQY
ncbi:MAG: flagellar motor protein MotB [Rickettsiales bacterium]|nr:flagellar motor protein MotB [Rickettsiales bacterium]